MLRSGARKRALRHLLKSPTLAAKQRPTHAIPALRWYYDWLEKGDTNVQDIMARKGVDVPRLGGDEALSIYQEWKDQDR